MKTRSGRAAVALALLVLTTACSDETRVDTGTGNNSSSTTFECPPVSSENDGPCGAVGFEELRALNLRYAERLDFTGDVGAATALADEIRVALEPTASTLPRPSIAEVQAALEPWREDGRFVQVSDNAVRTSGTAFAVPVDGGCVFGTVSDGSVTVEIGGYVNDGGCLASYGH